MDAAYFLLSGEERQVDQEQKLREKLFIRELVLDWRPTREQKLWATANFGEFPFYALG